MFNKRRWENNFQKQSIQKSVSTYLSLFEGSLEKKWQCFPAKDLKKEITVKHIWSNAVYKSVIWLQMLYFSNYAYHLTFTFSISEMLDIPFGSSA